MYADVSVTYIPGHNPDLVVRDNGKEERINLVRYKTTDDLHSLFEQKGFRRKMTVDCEHRVVAGECDTNPDHMNERCANACDKGEL